MREHLHWHRVLLYFKWIHRKEKTKCGFFFVFVRIGFLGFYSIIFRCWPFSIDYSSIGIIRVRFLLLLLYWDSISNIKLTTIITCIHNENNYRSGIWWSLLMWFFVRLTRPFCILKCIFHNSIDDTTSLTNGDHRTIGNWMGSRYKTFHLKQF